MDWSKAKTILILSFFVLDAVLGYLIWSSNRAELEGSISTEDSIEAFDQLLSQHNIHVGVEVPSTVPTLSSLNVRYKVFSAENFQENNRNKRQEIMKIDEEGFSARFISPIAFSSNEEALGILKGEVFFFDQYKQIDSIASSKKMIFVQQKDGYPLFDAKITVSTYQNNMLDYSQSYYEIISEAAAGKKVISGFTALRTLVEGGHLPKYETVNEIELGYYGQMVSSEQQILTPVWRIKVKSGQTYNVNAFTGGIEKTT